MRVLICSVLGIRKEGGKLPGRWRFNNPRTETYRLADLNESIRAGNFQAGRIKTTQGWNFQAGGIKTPPRPEFKILRVENGLHGPGIKLNIKFPVYCTEINFQGPQVGFCRLETTNFQSIPTLGGIFFAVYDMHSAGSYHRPILSRLESNHCVCVWHLALP
jgi:hypothetical protein